jgi:hypothetical protein
MSGGKAGKGVVMVSHITEMLFFYEKNMHWEAGITSHTQGHIWLTVFEIGTLL